MIKKILFLFLTLFLISCGTQEKAAEVSGYNESDVVLTDVPEPVEEKVVEKPKVEEKPKEDPNKKIAEEKMDAFKDKYKEAQKLVKDYESNETEIAQGYMDSARDLKKQAENEFEKGNYEKSIKYSDDALAVLDVKF